jgi:hypothetical protein
VPTHIIHPLEIVYLRIYGLDIYVEQVPTGQGRCLTILLKQRIRSPWRKVKFMSCLIMEAPVAGRKVWMTGAELVSSPAIMWN